ncbi:MAG TPA: zinc ribbon domain-containing protein [Clostridia bacterium]|nr:zinc ribbon domain-containing protein [Clostridia bacterium]
MPDVVRNDTQEYWRPAQPPRTNLNASPTEVLCANCGTEYALGARFCHVCGAERETQMGMGGVRPAFSRMLDFDQIKERLGMSSASLVLMVVGFACALAAMLTGVIYTANTVLDWQAVQIWRIEWMLAALVAFGAAILLRKSGE